MTAPFLPPAVIEQRSDERQVFELLNALRKRIIGIGLPGLVGPGVLQVSGGIMSALALDPTRVLFGGPAGLIAQSSHLRFVDGFIWPQLLLPRGSADNEPFSDLIFPALAFENDPNTGFQALMGGGAVDFYSFGGQDFGAGVPRGRNIRFGNADITIYPAPCRIILGGSATAFLRGNANGSLNLVGFGTTPGEGAVVIGEDGALATTDGGRHLQIPSMPGVPTAALGAAAHSGKIAIVYDSAHERVYARNLGDTLWLPVGQYTGGSGSGFNKTDNRGRWSVDTATYVSSARVINTTAPLTGGGNLSADRTFAVSDFVASGASHARGAVPDPGAAAGSTKFLREDATFAVPAYPTALPPNGSAGGDLTGTYPNPTIGANKVTDAKFRQSTGRTVVGKPNAGTGDVSDIGPAANDGDVLYRFGGSLGFAPLQHQYLTGLPPMTLAYYTEANLYGQGAYLPTSRETLTANAAEYAPGTFIVTSVKMTIKLLSNPLVGGSVTVKVVSSTLAATIVTRTYNVGDPAGVTTITGATGSASAVDTYGLIVDETTAVGVSNFALSVTVILS